ncbi:MAG: hypothetical protein U0441_35150 [Polyangiaceae bacterium]
MSGSVFGCGGASSASSGATGAGGGIETGGNGGGNTGDVAALALPPLQNVNNGRFATSPTCKQCHSNSANATAMRDEKKEPIGFFDLWQATMMGGSARDPLWRAVVSAEVAAAPSQKDHIEAKCMRCHAPMGSADAQLAGGDPMKMTMIGDGTDRGTLALDGVSCALCHQIQPSHLGEDQSFSGRYVIDAVGEIYGPHAAPFTMPMVHHTGFTPVQAAHVRKSSLCGTCHTLETEALDAAGEPQGMVLPEQTPYLEWRSSAFNDEGSKPGPKAKSCQGCHVPTDSAAGVPIETKIARNPGGFDFPPVSPRTPVGRHLFVGGNTLVPALFIAWPDVLQPQAPAAAFERIIALAREQLSSYSVKLTLKETARDGGEIVVKVRLDNLTGHKFPTAHPARRAWLRLVVRDKAGGVVFASGAFDADGRLLDSVGTPLPSEAANGPTLPHMDVVTGAEKPYVLESVMADAGGAPTYSLIRGAKYLKDSRLLPQGFAPSAADAPRVAAVGTSADATFAAGGDEVTYRAAAPAGKGPYSVTATLVYTPLSARYAAELSHWDTPEVKALFKMLAKVSRAPEIVAEAAASVD